MSIDDSYTVERVLSHGAGGVTELVMLDGTGPFVRKRIPLNLARRGVWAVLPETNCKRLPHIEATYEMPDEFVVVYDYVPGESLEQLIDGTGRMEVAAAQQLVCEVCEAVSALHEHGIVHRDITPANVIVAADGAHLIDFGIAKLGPEGTGKDTQQLGTWGFAAPEQYGFAQTDVRSDVYSIGQLLGYVITGVHPSSKDAYEQALSDENVVPAPVRTTIERATAFEPSARYQSVAELAAAIKQTGNGLGNTQAASPMGAAARYPASSAAPNASTVASNYGSKGAAPSDSSKRRAAKNKRARNKKGSTAAIIAIVVIVVAVLLSSVFANTGGDDASSTSSSTPSASETSDTSNSDAGSTSSASKTTNTSNAGTSSGSSRIDGALSVVESFCRQDSSGYAIFAFGVRNNTSSTIEFPKVKVTGYAEDGSVVFSQDCVLPVIAPGQTIYTSSQSSTSAAPARVEAVPIQPQSSYLREWEPPLYSTSNVSEALVNMGGYKVSGMVTLDEVGTDESYSQVHVCAVFRDENGNIVDAHCAYPSSSLTEAGQSMPFEVVMHSTIEHATCEVYATAWG